jgi:cytochrome c biogenesis protein CcdA
MTGLGQPSLLVVAYATGVLMFFAPCSVGLLPAYLTYFKTHSDGGRAVTLFEATHQFRWLPRILGGIGAILFFAGAIPLFYMAVAGLRILLPGYQIIVPLAQSASGSYLPSVVLVTVGTLILLQGLVLVTGLSGLYFGLITTLGVIITYLIIGLPVVILGQWMKQYLLQLQLLSGPMIIALGLLYYNGTSLPTVPRLPARTSSSTGSFFSFGVLYGIGSLACNLPLFLGVILSVFTTDGIVSGLAVFGAFAAGMGTLMIGVSVLTAVTGRSYSLGRYAHHVRTLGSLGFILIGGYVTWYTLTAFGYL